MKQPRKNGSAYLYIEKMNEIGVRMREERKLADKHGMTEEMAATKVEAMVRGNADRVRVKKLQEERIKEKAAKEAEGGD